MTPRSWAEIMRATSMSVGQSGRGEIGILGDPSRKRIVRILGGAQGLTESEIGEILTGVR